MAAVAAGIADQIADASASSRWAASAGGSRAAGQRNRLAVAPRRRDDLVEEALQVDSIGASDPSPRAKSR